MSKYLTPSRHYIRIPNELIADRTLPEMVRVLYCIMAYLLSIPGFVITIGALRKYTGKSAATISAALSAEAWLPPAVPQLLQRKVGVGLCAVLGAPE